MPGSLGVGPYRVNLWTDGSVASNPGPGGWAYYTEYVTDYAPHETVLNVPGLQHYFGSGHSLFTTNNRMELRPVVEGLKALQPGNTIHVYSDSSYLINTFRQGWLKNWKRRGWRTAEGKPVKNKDVWIELQVQVDRHKAVTWEHVKGHSGVLLNEWCDREAKKQSRWAAHLDKVVVITSVEEAPSGLRLAYTDLVPPDLLGKKLPTSTSTFYPTRIIPSSIKAGTVLKMYSGNPPGWYPIQICDLQDVCVWLTQLKAGY